MYWDIWVIFTESVPKKEKVPKSTNQLPNVQKRPKNCDKKMSKSSKKCQNMTNVTKSEVRKSAKKYQKWQKDFISRCLKFPIYFIILNAFLQ